ncbi:glycosyltransferase family 2 protein [soil metagenome]
MSTDVPHVAVVVAVRNAAATIGRCMESVLEQDHPGVQLIVMDGASTDGTRVVIARHAERIHHWESEPDRGVYHAWNKALDHVTAEWVCFLGADDRLVGPEALGRMASALAEAARDGGVRVVYGSVNVVDGEGSTLRTLGLPWEDAGPRFRLEMSLPNPATFYHRVLFDAHGRFDESFRIAGDYEFLLRELLDHQAVFVPDVTVVEMGSGGLSDSPRTMARHVRETHRARYMHGLAGTPDWRSFDVLRAVAHARLSQAFGRRAADRAGAAYRMLARKPRRSGRA